MINFLLTYFTLLIAACLFIIGWYILTRHSRRELPDGTIKAYGYIFKWWSQFWEHTMKFKKAYYTGDGLAARLSLIEKENPTLSRKLEFCNGRHSLHITEPLTDPDLYYLEQTIAEGVLVKSGNILFLYENVPVYRFPYWLREPLSGCPVCMASIYGSGWWWMAALMFPDMYIWAEKPVLCQWLFWPLFCISLALVNKIAATKLKL